MLTVVPVYGGPLASISYIIQIEDGCWIVDCGDYPALIPHIKSPVKGVLLTHGHFDHIRGINELLFDFPRPKVFTNETGREMLKDSRKNLSYYQALDFSIENSSSIEIVEDRKNVYLEDNTFAQPIYTPGHHQSCITWIIDNSIFTGDSFIPGTSTVTKLPGGNIVDNIRSLDMIYKLSVGRKIYPGHKI